MNASVYSSIRGAGDDPERGEKGRKQNVCHAVCALPSCEGSASEELSMGQQKEPSAGKKRVRVAAVADLHCTKTSQGAFQPLFAQISERADLLLLCGDLTDHGLPEEAQVLLKELTGLKLPMIAVFGNHDWHSGKQEE